MAVLQGWLPPTRENYEIMLNIWQYGLPLGASIQWLTSWYGMGKTSQRSIFNLPGRFAWLTMEIPGFLVLLYTVRASRVLNIISPDTHPLPWQNQVLAALFVIHYVHRAIIYPFLQPSMAPIHVFIWSSAIAFQVVNGTLLGAWLGAYGPLTQAAWNEQLAPFGTGQFAAGIALFYLGLAANYYHDDELREIRRRADEKQKRKVREAGKAGGSSSSIAKHYEVPEAGFFKIMLFPHYFFEWVEWTGFWMAAGWGCLPARAFLVNEIASMLPRAVNGRKWYVEKFGEEKIKRRWAVIPGVV